MAMSTLYIILVDFVLLLLFSFPAETSLSNRDIADMLGDPCPDSDHGLQEVPGQRDRFCCPCGRNKRVVSFCRNHNLSSTMCEQCPPGTGIDFEAHLQQDCQPVYHGKQNLLSTTTESKPTISQRTIVWLSSKHQKLTGKPIGSQSFGIQDTRKNERKQNPTPTVVFSKQESQGSSASPSWLYVVIAFLGLALLLAVAKIFWTKYETAQQLPTNAENGKLLPATADSSPTDSNTTITGGETPDQRFLLSKVNQNINQNKDIVVEQQDDEKHEKTFTQVDNRSDQNVIEISRQFCEPSIPAKNKALPIDGSPAQTGQTVVELENASISRQFSQAAANQRLEEFTKLDQCIAGLPRTLVNITHLQLSSFGPYFELTPIQQTRCERDGMEDETLRLRELVRSVCDSTDNSAYEVVGYFMGPGQNRPLGQLLKNCLDRLRPSEQL